MDKFIDPQVGVSPFVAGTGVLWAAFSLGEWIQQITNR